MKKSIFIIVAFASSMAVAQNPTKLKLGHQFSAEILLSGAYSEWENNYFTAPIAGLGGRVSSSWFVAQRSRYRFGLNVSWLRTDFLMSFFDPHHPITTYPINNSIQVQIAPLHFGVGNSWEYKEGKEVTFNLNVGYSLLYEAGDFRDGLKHYFSINPQLKFSGEKYSIGIEYSLLSSFEQSLFYRRTNNVVSIVFGFKGSR
jgi:hypothetical protein